MTDPVTRTITFKGNIIKVYNWFTSKSFIVVPKWNITINFINITYSKTKHFIIENILHLLIARKNIYLNDNSYHL